MSGVLYTSCAWVCVVLDVYYLFCASVYGKGYISLMNVVFPGVWRGIKEKGGKEGLSISFSVRLLIFESCTKKWTLNNTIYKN